MAKKIFFVGNAHLDPVWMWNWQEGSAEAKATIRSALDRMEEYPAFRFVCSASSVFQWIEDFDAAMFEEIRRRVREGRFIIVGGWYVQPDCNLPSGEGFARQSLYAQRYFKEKFGVTAVTGYNVDSFGHNAMMPQILQKSGMKQYIYRRPDPTEMKLEGEVFRWESADGSQVLACRIPERYNHKFTSYEQLEINLAAIMEQDPDATEYLYMYGVGNHGCGPTKKNIELIREYARKHPELEIVFSDTEDFFNSARKRQDSLPLHTEDLQHHASGCYAAVSQIKNDIRRSENSLISAETYNILAGHLTGKAPATEALRSAWQDVLFCHFHDILGGCAIRSAYRDATEMLGESLSVAARITNSALQTVSWAIDTRNTAKGLPIVVFNPHSFPAKSVITVNKECHSVTDTNGAAVPIQHVYSPVHSCKSRDDTVFEADVPAMGYATYYMRPEDAEPAENTLKTWPTGMENENLRVEIESHTGYLLSLYDKKNGRELLKGYGAVPVVYDESDRDTWSHAKNYFDREIAKFADAEVRVLEEGPVQATIRVVSRYNGSTLTQRFILRRGGESLDIRAEIDWHEKHKLLKIAYETAAEHPEAYYEIPFGVLRRPCNGEEEPGQTWLAVRDGNYGLAMLNDNKYSFSVKDRTMNLTVVRSPIYGDHGGERTSQSEYTDQGTHEFCYNLLPMTGEDRWSKAIRAAKLLNVPFTNIVENNHRGTLADSFTGISSNKKNVTVTALKRAEDSDGVVLRIYETDGVKTSVIISGALMPVPLKTEITPYSVDTYCLKDGQTQWKKVLMTEFEG